MSTRLARPALALSLVLAGCYSYRLVPVTDLRPDDQVRVTTGDGDRITVHAATLAADTLRGISVRRRVFPYAERRVAVAMAVADLTKVEVRRLSVGRSVLAAGAIGAAIVIPALFVDWDHLFTNGRGIP